MPADNMRFCEIGGWSDSPKCGKCENRRWKSKRRTVESPTSQSRRLVARKRARTRWTTTWKIES